MKKKRRLGPPLGGEKSPGRGWREGESVYSGGTGGGGGGVKGFCNYELESSTTHLLMPLRSPHLYITSVAWISLVIKATNICRVE